jgi:hypothetical protein
MKQLLTMLFLSGTLAVHGQGRDALRTVPLDSIRLSDPAILADSATHQYYMTGTGGRLWKSRALRLWPGPYDVVDLDAASWMGPRPMIGRPSCTFIGADTHFRDV